MLIAVDIGNSNVNIGILQPESSDWSDVFRISPERIKTADDWRQQLSSHLTGDPVRTEAGRVICCSVVPSLTASFKEYAIRFLGVEMLLVSPALELGITVATEQPLQTGADRLVNAAAAFASYGGPVVVVDMGTATKIDAITGDGRFIGGAIAPGLGLSMDALVQRAAQLYTVPLDLPKRAIGPDTKSAMQAGVVLGHLKIIEGLVRQTVEELGGARAVVLTGGHANLIAENTNVITTVRPNLTLDGLRLIAGLNP